MGSSRSTKTFSCLHYLPAFLRVKRYLLLIKRKCVFSAALRRMHFRTISVPLCCPEGCSSSVNLWHILFCSSDACTFEQFPVATLLYSRLLKFSESLAHSILFIHAVSDTGTLLISNL